MPRNILEPLLVTLFLILISILAIISIDRLEQASRESIGKALRTVLFTTAESLNIWTEARLRDARGYASREDLLDLYKGLLEEEGDAEALRQSVNQSRLREILEPQLRVQGYTGYAVLSATSKSRVAEMHDAGIGKPHRISTVAPAVLKRLFSGESLIIPAATVKRSRGSSAFVGNSSYLTMYVGTPVMDESGSLIAALILRIDPIGGLSDITSLARIGVSGESYAFTRDGYLLTESRFNEQLRSIGLLSPGQASALTIRVADPGGDLTTGYLPLMERAQWPLTRMATSGIAGEDGLDTDGYRDYRGIPVFGAWLWNESLGLGVTTEINAEEALENYYFARNVLIASFSVAVLLCLFLIYYLSRTRSRAMGQLEQAHLALEGRVAERTAELWALNSDMQSEIERRARTEERLRLVQEQLEEKNCELSRLALLDGLTEIPNRRAFDECLAEEWSRSSRTGSELTVVFFDVDRFKDYNDRYGHLVGDKCLKRVAALLKRLANARRPGDIVARYGGEEFAAIYSGVDAKSVYPSVDNVREKIFAEAIEHLDGVSDQCLSVSVGLASMKVGRDSSPAELLDQADRALYQAKQAGRNRTVIAAECLAGGRSIGN